MTEDTDKREQSFGTFAALSVIWVVGIFLVAQCLGDGIFKLKPNEFGDLLAGTFAPLAAAWFVYAVFIQRAELSLQREELSETRAVLIDQQKSQEKLAISTDEGSKQKYIEILFNYILERKQKIFRYAQEMKKFFIQIKLNEKDLDTLIFRFKNKKDYYFELLISDIINFSSSIVVKNEIYCFYNDHNINMIKSKLTSIEHELKFIDDYCEIISNIDSNYVITKYKKYVLDRDRILEAINTLNNKLESQ
jgi:hypothetical protein